LNWNIGATMFTFSYVNGEKIHVDDDSDKFGLNLMLAPIEKVTDMMDALQDKLYELK
jgi:hypothetical protein